jgi:DNA-binding transcriptional ArsR family regulator
MGELVIGRPALQVRTAVSTPLDMVSIMSLLYRAVPGSGLDRWLINARRELPRQLQSDLDLLHGFSGRLLYFMEEPIMAFQPLEPEQANATVEDLVAFLDSLPAEAFREMIVKSQDRVHRDLGTGLVAPVGDPASENEWRRYIEPGLTTADADDVIALINNPEELKKRTIRLISGTWEYVYKAEYLRCKDELAESERLARAASSRGFGLAFAELTGNRLPATLAAGLNNVARVTFCPSAHLGAFVSYISYPPDLIVFFGTQNTHGIVQEVASYETAPAPDPASSDALYHSRDADPLTGEDLLESIRALGDGNRLRILDLLGGGELYAQEIVGRLGIAQSAVSRHLSQLERAGLVRVEPRRGMKYYAIDRGRLESLADTIRARAR